MRETTNGKLTVWRTHGPLEDLAFDLLADLTADGERLIVLDGAGSFDASRTGRGSASLGRNVHLLRTAPFGELESRVWPTLRAVQQQTGARRVLITGMPDRLHGRQMLARDSARALGRVKAALEELAAAGLQVTVVCRSGRTDLGVRTYLLSSLCAFAHEVRHWPSASEKYVDGASAAIA